MRLTLRIAAVLLIASATLLAQVRETVTVSVVEVPVTVLDRDGKPVRGLTAANFEILDEGKKRDVTGFDVIDFASVESIKATSPLNPAARRNFLVLFDLSFSSPGAIQRAQEAARDFMTKSVQKRDRVAVATVDVDKGFRMLTAFTTDRTLLANAINSPETFRGNDPLQIAGKTSIEVNESPSQMSGNAGQARDEATQNMVDMQRQQNRIDDAFNRQRIERQVNMLSGLARTLRSLNGQKHVLLLSEGFDARLVQGREARLAQEAAAEAAAVERGQVWNVDSDQRYGNASSLNLLDKMAQMFKRSDVVMHALDIKGLRVDNDAATGSARKSNEGLILLANSTGGQVFRNSNDLRGDFDRVIKTQEVVYILGFNAPTTEPGKFHNLKVRLVNVPGGRIAHRAGYFEAGGEGQMERTLSNAEIIINDIAQDAIQVAALAAPFPTESGQSQVPVILEISGADLMKAAKGNTATTEIFVYAFDEEGLVRDTLVQRMSLDMTKLGEQLKNSGIKYYGTLSLPPGNYAVKTLVRVAETETKGYRRSDVVVPAASDVAVSQPFFYEDPGRWVMVKGTSNDKTNAGYPFEVNGEPFIPSAGVRVKNGEARKFAVFVQNASPDELTFETAPAATLVSQLKSAHGTKLVFQLDKVPTNVASLNVTVRKKGSTDARTTVVPIQVQ